MRTRTARRAGTVLVLGCVLAAGLAGIPAQAETPPPGPAPAVLAPVPVQGATAPVPTKASLEAMAAKTLRKAALGSFSAVVVDPATGEVLYEREALKPRIPASTLKLLTAATALHVLDPQARLATRVVVSGDVITLIGGGDSTLARRPKASSGLASLTELADAVAEQVQTSRVRLQVDDSLFTGPELAPGWPKTFPAAGVVAPVTALMVDQGRVRPGANARVPDPARQAGQVFAAMLRDRGVTVASVRPGSAESGATEIARVESPPVVALVQRMLTDSDNDLAEALAHLAGAKANGSGSFAGGAKAMAAAAKELRIEAGALSVVDGSGLSGRDTVSAAALADILVAVARAQDPVLSTIGLDLPVAGFTGTLADRFTGSAAAGLVRAKTGTLTGVTSLAGSVVDRDGRLLVFTVLANDVRSIPGARRSLDQFSSRLAKCGCR